MLFSVSGCAEKQRVKPVYKDTLVITNEEKNYLGAKSRFESVLTSMKTRVTILEKCKNDQLIDENPEGYFLDKDYIYSSFDPFILKTFYITENFDENLSAENAPSIFSSESEGFSVVYSGDDSVKTLKFVNEQTTKTYVAEYDSGSDSFRYTYSEDSPEQNGMVEFLEFITVSEGTYAVQSRDTRCWISFDEDGNVTYFVCVQLKEPSYSLEDSIFGSGSAEITSFKNKVSQAKKSDYDKIREYKDGTLYYTDITKENSISIYADAYKSAFVM